MDDKLLRDQARRSDKQGAALLNDCEDLIKVRQSISTELNLEVWRRELEVLRKRELGYRRWHTQIYAPMSERLTKPQKWFEEQHLMRQKTGDDFVRQRHVFLDVDSPDKYCAHPKIAGAITRLQTAPSRDRTASKDQTLSAARQRTDEEKALMQCITPALRKATTDDIDEILRPGSKGFRVKDSRDWQNYLDRDISSRPRNKSLVMFKRHFTNLVTI